MRIKCLAQEKSTETLTIGLYPDCLICSPLHHLLNHCVPRTKDYTRQQQYPNIVVSGIFVHPTLEGLKYAATKHWFVEIAEQ